MQGQHTCSICLEELPGASFVWPGGCDHASCKDCVRQLCNLHVAEGGLENLRCPDPKCKEPFSRQVLFSDLLITFQVAGPSSENCRQSLIMAAVLAWRNPEQGVSAYHLACSWCAWHAPT